MLKSIYKYSKAIDAKGENQATESLIMSLLLEQLQKIKAMLILGNEKEKDTINNSNRYSKKYNKF